MRTIFFTAAFLLLTVLKSHASLPEPLAQSLAEAKQAFSEYSKKSSDEILDQQYDESEIALLTHIDLGEMFEGEETSADAEAYRLETIKLLVWAFNSSQLEALPTALLESSTQFNNDPQVLTRNLATVDLAYRLKKGKIKESALKDELSKAPFKN